MRAFFNPVLLGAWPVLWTAQANPQEDLSCQIPNPNH